MYEKLLNYAFYLLARKRYTKSEINKKLNKYLLKRKDKFQEMHGENWLEEGNKAQVKVLERLIELKYVDDRQFALDYIRQKVKFKPRGRYRISRELRMKGVSKEFVDDGYDELEVEEEEVAIRCLSKKMKMWKKLDYKQFREKSFRFLCSRGFGLDAIYKALEACYNHSEE